MNASKLFCLSKSFITIKKKEMKKLFKIYSLTVWATLFINSITAQTYFAGAGAGAGNTGTLVTGVGNFAPLDHPIAAVRMPLLATTPLFKNTVQELIIVHLA
jgi:hypothetical protein